MYIYLIPISLLILILAVWLYLRHRKRHIVLSWHEDADDAPLQDVDLSVTIVVLSGNSPSDLETTVRHMIEQGSVAHEVLVVNTSTERSVADAIKRLATTYPGLRQTYVPSCRNGLNANSVAYLLGVRSARYPWVAYVHAGFVPPSNLWLLDLLQYADHSVHAIVDYGHDAELSEHTRRQRRRQSKEMARAARRGRAIETAGGSFIVQRDWFLSVLSGETPETEVIYLYWLLSPWQRVILRARSHQPASAFRR